MVRKFITSVAIGGLMVLSACNTVKGAGQDIQSVGKCGEDAMDGHDC
ncbi:entericidin A/B family lipoprotein [Sphingomicrobium clamense]|uniref:Entericidin A/B family lipoprotein n=1 Tax=Sphingomicrobium clamense TaxID=2851013 RepID=A0ABS6V4Q3_9SPHN|nr:entericidin A/B family lipoprotein [Sphingomicrobium sp. B8]MBW0144539.1 entericidin A/B family lipoprotein [Sphingomicrobium sp. B8]